MSTDGRNVPGFVDHQVAFAAHIRNPQINEVPEGLEARRLKIYVDLFYRNIEGFLANAFPVCKRILTHDNPPGTPWHDLVRQFVHSHPSSSPYFLEIPQEFLTFVQQTASDQLPDWFLELAHYEWVELALAVAEEEIPDTGFDASGDLSGKVVLSPLIWPLTYRYAVHQIGPEVQPKEAPQAPTYLIVYRRRDESVHFMASNAITHRLLALIDEGRTGNEAVETVAAELGRDAADLQAPGAAALAKLRETGIILGAAV